MTSLREIQQSQKEFILSRKWERFSGTQVFSHLIEELGEIIKHFLYDEKYKVKGAGHEGKTEGLQEEFAQAFNLFLQLAIKANVDLEHAWLMEYERNKSRFPKEIWEQLAEDNQ